VGHVTDDVRVNVLGPVELIIDGERKALPSGSVLTKLLALLALGPESGLPAARLSNLVWPERTGPDPENKLQQAMRRLRQAGLGDRLPPQRDGRYRLDLRADQIDARSLCATADALDGDSAPGDAAIEAALALWRGEPAQDAGITARFGAAAYDARRRLMAERRKRARPRILILDDKVGDKIAQLLGDYSCTVLTGIEEFWPVADQLDELFDAALVDLHLSEDDLGAEGLAAVDALRNRSSVPTVLMTFKPQEGSLDGLMRRYNLFGFFVKSGNTKSGDFTRLRELVADLLGDGTEQILVQRLDEDLARCERRAALRIRLHGDSGVAKRQMEHEVDEVRRLIRAGGTLADVRAAVAAFARQWLPEDG
jgi:hypothetical protein